MKSKNVVLHRQQSNKMSVACVRQEKKMSVASVRQETHMLNIYVTNEQNNRGKSAS